MVRVMMSVLHIQSCPLRCAAHGVRPVRKLRAELKGRMDRTSMLQELLLDSDALQQFRCYIARTIAQTIIPGNHNTCILLTCVVAL